MQNRIQPQAGQESVWDYPRPPRLERTSKRLRVVFNGVTIADAVNAYRVLETSHPPAYYLPQADIAMQYVHRVPNKQTFCEFKGAASYWTIRVNGQEAPASAWSYANPNAEYAPITDYLSFYAGRMQACYVDEELVTAQAGDFYGGWITQDIVGPFKGGTGTWGW